MVEPASAPGEDLPEREVAEWDQEAVVGASKSSVCYGSDDQQQWFEGEVWAVEEVPEKAVGPAGLFRYPEEASQVSGANILRRESSTYFLLQSATAR
jgi:hypothetical protein